MEARTFLLHSATPWKPKSPPLSPPPPPFLRPVKASSNLRFKGPKPRKDWIADWVSENDDALRSLPIYVGGASLLAVLFNRAVSGIAPVADASSSQSRADLLTLGLAVTNMLAGLVWLTIRPKPVSVVTPQGVECRNIYSYLPHRVVSELLWVWESLSAATCCRSVVVIYNYSCVLQIGVAAVLTDNGEAMPVDAAKLIQGTIYQGVMKSGAQSYLANLSLYPGRSELPFLPSNTQAVILQPLGEKGVLIIGGDTIRGFTNSDQRIRVIKGPAYFAFHSKAWITLIGEKLEATLVKFTVDIPLAVQDRV